MTAVPAGPGSDWTAEVCAFVFPGQGSQYPGMGRELGWCDAEARVVVGVATDVTGLPVHELLTTADAATIAAPDIAQILVFVHSITLLHRLRADGVDCHVTAGHSLGEYSAMVAAGMLDWTDGLQVVAARGAAMADAAREAPGAMAAVVGLDAERLAVLCTAATDTVVLANVNSARQVVVSGSAAGVAEVAAAAAAAGALRVRTLPVGGAYHSPLMAPAQDRLAPLLRAVPIAEPVCPIVSSITGCPVTDPEVHRTLLLGQITAVVRWRAVVEHLAGSGVTRHLEIGPGRVLGGLGRETHRAAVHDVVRPRRGGAPASSLEAVR